MAQATMQWRMVTLWPKKSPVFKALERFAGLVEQGSNGRLSISILERGALGPPPKMMSVVKEGQAELGHAVPLLWGKQSPAALLLLYFPFGLTLQEKEAWLRFGGGSKVVDRIYGEMGCKFVSLGTSAPQMGGWFQKEINSLEDLRNVRIRIGGVGATVMSALGAKAVRLPTSGVPAAFAKGEIDAAELRTPAADLKDGMYEFAKYYYYPNWHEPALTFDLFINRARWDALPGDLKSVIEMAASLVHQEMIGRGYFSNTTALDILTKEHGVQIKRFPDSVMDALRRESDSALASLAAKDAMSKSFIDSALAFRAKVEKWTMISEYSYLTARQRALM
jgi:TRAP-type mannitol/chloroaromatic compound transport system substrate-binding protein